MTRDRSIVAPSCNRLENAVKPQHDMAARRSLVGCNRLENVVKPQLDGSELTSKSGCNRLENAVKPQLFRFAFARALLL